MITNELKILKENGIGRVRSKTRKKLKELNFNLLINWKEWKK